MSMPLEIHHINVSQGDSTLIIWRNLERLRDVLAQFPGSGETGPMQIPEDDYLPYALKYNVDLSGTVDAAVLIDAGEDIYGPDVYDYLVKNGVTEREKFAIVVTHCHSDHVDGVRNIFWSSWDGKDQYIQRFVPAVIYDCFGGMLGKPPQTASYDLYMREVDKLAGEGQLEHVYVEPGMEICLGDYGVTRTLLRCVGANGKSFSGDELKNTICTSLKTYAKAERSQKAIDPNALSVCLVLEQDHFRYFLGGDIAGTGDERGGNRGINRISQELPLFSQHPDVETELRDLLKLFYPKERNSDCSCDGHMCGWKVSHHGSATSNDVYTLGMMQPKIAVISSGVKARFHHHPSQECLNRLDAAISATWEDYNSNTKKTSIVPNTIENYYITEMAADNGSENFVRTFPNGKILGDIIVRPDIKTTKETAQGVEMQVFGSGVQSGINTGKWKLRETYKDAQKSSPDYYPIGPFYHKCDRH